MKKYIISVLLLSFFIINISAKDLIVNVFPQIEGADQGPIKAGHFGWWNNFEILAEVFHDMESKDVETVDHPNKNAAVQNNPNPMHTVEGGDVYIETMNFGFVMKNQDGECYRYTPDVNGNLISTQVVCSN